MIGTWSPYQHRLAGLSDEVKEEVKEVVAFLRERLSQLPADVRSLISEEASSPSSSSAPATGS